MNCGILVPLREEFRTLYETLGTWEEEREDYYHIHRLENPAGETINIIAMISGRDHTMALQATTRMIKTWSPECLMLCGIAGGLNQDVRLGDLVLGTGVNCFLEGSRLTYAADGKNELHFAGEYFPIKSPFTEFIENFEFSFPAAFRNWQSDCARFYPGGDQPDADSLPRLHTGKIAYSPFVIADEGFKKGLLDNDRQLLAVETEAKGFLDAVHLAGYRQPAIILRGISDFADQHKSRLDSSGGGSSRRQAMYNLVSLLKHALPPFLEAWMRADPPAPAPAKQITNHPAKISIDILKLRNTLKDPEKIFVDTKFKFSGSEANVFLFKHLLEHYQQKHRYVILGNYGAGKSHLLRKISGLYYNARTILVELKEYSHSEGSILEVLLQKTLKAGLRVSSLEDLKALLESRQLVALLDGFDELPHILSGGADPIAYLEHFESLFELKSACFFLTSRTNIFKGHEKQLAEKHTIIFGELQPWDSLQWKQYLRQCNLMGWVFPAASDSGLTDWEVFYTRINANAQLKTLTNKPLFAFLLVQTSYNSTAIDSTWQLYSLYIDETLRLNALRSGLTAAEQRSCLEKTALYMFETDRSLIRKKELEEKIFKPGLPRLDENEITLQLDFLYYYSMLELRESVQLAFSHKTIQDYFISSRIILWLQTEDRESLRSLALNALSQEAVEFIAGNLETPVWSSIQNALKAQFTGSFLPMALLGETEQAKILRNFACIHLDKFKKLPENTILRNVHFDNLNLDNMVFDNTTLSSSTFIQSSLRGASFCGSILRRSHFIESDLSHADFTSADLSFSHFTKIRSTAQALIVGAKMTGSIIEDLNIFREN